MPQRKIYLLESMADTFQTDVRAMTAVAIKHRGETVHTLFIGEGANYLMTEAYCRRKNIVKKFITAESSLEKKAFEIWQYAKEHPQAATFVYIGAPSLQPMEQILSQKDFRTTLVQLGNQ